MSHGLVPGHLRLRAASAVGEWPKADPVRLPVGFGKFRTPSARYLRAGKPGLASDSRVSRPKGKRVRVKGMML